MFRRPPVSTPSDTHFPYPPLFRSFRMNHGDAAGYLARHAVPQVIGEPALVAVIRSVVRVPDDAADGPDHAPAHGIADPVYGQLPALRRDVVSEIGRAHV